MQIYDENAKVQATATADDIISMYQGDPGEGYNVDARHSEVEELSTTKVAEDDHTILIPQPTNDPNDPLNWTFAKKHLMLAIISFISFLPRLWSLNRDSSLLATVRVQSCRREEQLCQYDRISATADSIRTDTGHISPSTTQKSLVGCLVTLGVGGLVFVAFAAYFGRLPTLLFFQFVTFASGIWCATETSFDSYSAARTVYGFFATTGLSVSLTKLSYCRLRSLHGMTLRPGWVVMDPRHVLLPRASVSCRQTVILG